MKGSDGCETRGQQMNRSTRGREESPVRVGAGPLTLEGNLGIPEGARGVVLE